MTSWKHGAPEVAYVSSKGAVIAMTRSLCKELGKFGVNVNAVAPDWIPLGADRDNPPPYAESVPRPPI